MLLFSSLRHSSTRLAALVRISTAGKCTTGVSRSSNLKFSFEGLSSVMASPNTAAIPKVIYVPPALKQPVELPTLRSSMEYNLPSIVKPSSVIGDVRTIIAPTTDISNQIEKSDPSVSTVTKQAAELVQIRKRKMKKHKLQKLRKRMHFAWAKRRFRRLKKKEQVFRAELLAQIQEAHAFDAEKYVDGILEKLRNRPKPETPEERRERFMDLMRKYRSNVEWIKPKFD
ncbi:uncharacterized protein LOC135371233 [Ornithodoros turicata]|uniref:uncharacterized protein LOC135371233 n=1 Tax=Ornithodoros turicata TaxID=34597 RepID=UPI0031392E51